MRIALALWCLAVCGCGYVGDPLPPALNIPDRVHELRVSEVGERLVIEFSTPKLTTEGLAVRKLEAPRITLNGVAVPVDAAPGEQARYELPASKWAGQKVTVEVRAVANGKVSSPATATLDVVEPVAPPAEIRAETTASGVQLTWSAAPRSGVQFAVTRQTGNAAPVVVGRVAAPPFVDTGVEYGTEYKYRVQAAAGAALSEESGPVSITPVDKFPPAVPVGLTAVAGVNSIELAWERNTELDLRGYRVYRAVKGAQAELLADNVEGPAYSDRQAESGKTYSFAVSSIDQRGNESARSAAVEITAP